MASHPPSPAAPLALPPVRGLSVRARILVRLYMATMRFESMAMLGMRRTLVGWILGHRLHNVNIFAGVAIDG
ncbi:MAG: hypothetical protein M3R41_01735, partial [Pseudomonadota bacterium]|nr:hypothetical protein [Pseudomonadota bacterium]